MLTSDGPICNATRLNRPCPGCSELRARVERLEARLERVDPTPEPDPVPALVRALAETFGKSCFMARDVLQRASDDADHAAARGEPEPELSSILRELGIEDAVSLGIQLGTYADADLGIKRGGLVHKTNTWEVLAWVMRA